MKEIKDLIASKSQMEVGETFEMFGSTYVACNSKCCCDCAFYDAHCDLNVDIPSCDNDIHFEKC